MIRPKLNRRRFLKRTSAAVLGAGILGTKAIGAKSDNQISSGPQIKDYRIFSRTGFIVSDISCGTFREDSVLKAMLDRGANLIETSEVYSNGNHERQIRNILKDYQRDKIFLVSKIQSSSGPFTSKTEVKSRFYKSLERLQTDHIDGYMIHSALSSDDIRNSYFHAAIKELKKEGKVRFTGVSCHGSSYFDNPDESMEQVLGTAIEDGRFDFVELIYNFFEPDMRARILEKCGEHVGTSDLHAHISLNCYV
ncbi:MAG TPA: aldo/keto reductase [Bacteroidales bacterium]|nr:aldo/keto reductase [Bacteroidales bacterium]